MWELYKKHSVVDIVVLVCDNTFVMRFTKRIVPTLIALVAIAAVFAAGLYIGRTQLLRTEDTFIVSEGVGGPADVDLGLYWEVWGELDERFVGVSEEDIPTYEERLWGSIEGLTESFGDPYTVFLPPTQATLFEEDIRGNFGGVGMEIGVEDTVLTVIAPLKGTPADSAGIRAGDIIAAVDGESTVGMSIDEAVLNIRGEVGTEVVLTLLREGREEVFDITVVRDTIRIPTLETTLRPDGVFVISLFNFNATSPQDFRGALREFFLSGSEELVLDLRGNPGGFLQAAVDISSWFLPLGSVVVSEEGEEDVIVHRSRGYDIFNEDVLEMVVLVDGGSASASEIVAGALQDHNIATVVGAQTFGKGSVQELVDTGSDSSLRITIAHWKTPNGTSISEGGLTPDVVVEYTQSDFDAGVDPQMERAVELLLGS